MNPIQIWIGWTPKEQDAWDVAYASIKRHVSAPVEIHPLMLSHLEGLLHRPIEQRDGKLWCPISQAPMATEFAISRFAIPAIARGWALFVDCDVLCLADIAELFALADPRYAVQVVKHKQESGPETKMDGQAQTYYSRKNWSSVVLWNMEHQGTKRFTTHMLNTWPGRDLHAFKWLHDDEIGELPPEWNYLVGVSPKLENPKLAHFTLGTPNMPGYENCEFADAWRAESALARSPTTV